MHFWAFIYKHDLVTTWEISCISNLTTNFFNKPFNLLKYEPLEVVWVRTNNILTCTLSPGVVMTQLFASIDSFRYTTIHITMNVLGIKVWSCVVLLINRSISVPTRVIIVILYRVSFLFCSFFSMISFILHLFCHIQVSFVYTVQTLYGGLLFFNCLT